MNDYDPVDDIMFRRLFLEERPLNLLFLLNSLLEYEGEKKLINVESAERRCEYLNNRHSCEMVTVLAVTEEKIPCLILIALNPHPASKKYVLPLMLAEARKIRKKRSRYSLAGRGIMLSSCAYDHFRRDKYYRNNPLYAKQEVEGGQLLFTEINLFRLASPFPRRSLSRREECMYFLNYAPIYIHAEPTYSLPTFLKGSLSSVWESYCSDCADERLYWRILEYERACFEENTRLAEVIRRARRAGEEDAREFLITELEKVGIDSQTITATVASVGSQQDESDD